MPVNVIIFNAYDCSIVPQSCALCLAFTTKKMIVSLDNFMMETSYCFSCIFLYIKQPYVSGDVLYMHTKVLLSGRIRVVNNAGHALTVFKQHSKTRCVRVTKYYPNHSSLRLKT